MPIFINKINILNLQKHPPIEAPDGSIGDASSTGGPPPYDDDYHQNGPGGPPQGGPQGYVPRMRVDPSITICRYFLRGFCKRGDTCAFLHQTPFVYNVESNLKINN